MPTPLPTLPGVYYTYVWMTHSGLRVGSTFTFKNDVPAGSIATAQFQAQTIADSLCARWNSNMLADYPSSVTGTDSRVYALEFPAMPAVFGHASGTASGGAGEAPPAVAAVLRHHVFRRGRGSQSHTAISPLLLSQLNADHNGVNAAFITNRTIDFENFIGEVQGDFTTATSGGEIAFVQLSKKGAGATYAITSSVFEEILGTERSRTLRP